MLCGIVETDERTDELLRAFYDLHMSETFNLTSIKEPAEFYLKHYLDSVYYFYKNGAPSGTLADIGSGGGFPGMVLGIFYPSLKICLIESIGKKCRFLEKAAAALELDNVEVVNSRAEAVKAGVFDYITARGVCSAGEILKNTWHMSKRSTEWILYKGEKVFDELREAAPFINRRNIHVETIRVEEPFTRTYCVLSR